MFGQMGPTYIKAFPLAVAAPHISSSYHSLLLTLGLTWYALSHRLLCLRVFCFIAGRCPLVLTHLLTRSALGGVASRDYKTRFWPSLVRSLPSVALLTSLLFCRRMLPTILAHQLTRSALGSVASRGFKTIASGNSLSVFPVLFASCLCGRPYSAWSSQFSLSEFLWLRVFR
ncbi:hypothetical protein BC629DRAFT_1025088 [Irpex lacteus]|nr:hypothetical protein BC629DRAFT_1025088 [Irpex lacteus]